jgi:hypothetical protein
MNELSQVADVVGTSLSVHHHDAFDLLQIQQRQCEVCKGSGLVLKGRYYRRCGACGEYVEAGTLNVSPASIQLLRCLLYYPEARA